MIKAADMLIARRADTRARADFATWKMMAKLNGTSSLPAEAQAFLESYKALLKEMTESEATEAMINLLRGDGRGRLTTGRSNSFDLSGDEQRHCFQTPASSTAHGRAQPASQTSASRGADIRLRCRRIRWLAIFRLVIANARLRIIPGNVAQEFSFAP